MHPTFLSLSYLFYSNAWKFHVVFSLCSITGKHFSNIYTGEVGCRWCNVAACDVRPKKMCVSHNTFFKNRVSRSVFLFFFFFFCFVLLVTLINNNAPTKAFPVQELSEIGYLHKAKKKKGLFPVSRPTLFFGTDP